MKTVQLFPGNRIAGRSARLARFAVVVCGLVGCMALADGSWLRKVPADYHSRTNPYAGQADAIAGGGKLFADHCAKCHGNDALGTGKKPSLRSDRVQNVATEGDIFWLLKNGNLAKGMPTWSAIPEPSRWQIVAFVKSLGAAPDATPYGNSKQEKPQ
jgi:mono/diheme cytochrome c family protein